MLEVLRKTNPVAAREYRCMFCGCNIQKGERYERATTKFDGRIYDFINHEDCFILAHKEDWFNTDSDGLDEYEFSENLLQYIDFYYRDEQTDDIPKSMQSLSNIELVRKALADYDEPSIKRKRLKADIEELEFRKKCRGGSLSKYDANRLEEYKNELITLEG